MCISRCLYENEYPVVWYQISCTKIQLVWEKYYFPYVAFLTVKYRMMGTLKFSKEKKCQSFKDKVNQVDGVSELRVNNPQRFKMALHGSVLNDPTWINSGNLVKSSGKI